MSPAFATVVEFNLLIYVIKCKKVIICVNVCLFFNNLDQVSLMLEISLFFLLKGHDSVAGSLYKRISGLIACVITVI